jgi:3-oxoacyl-(acyl-carrier-protein) synthase/NADP-dependent 3-hydroxy acid dehydrogenase YdfG
MTQLASQASVNEYPVGVFTSVFTGTEAFLADHIIQEKKILPGMAYLEIARAAVAGSIALNENQILVLSESIFINALVVNEARSLDVKVYPGATGEFGVEVSTDQGMHFQSKVYVHDKTELRLKAKLPEKIDLTDWEKRCSMTGPTKSQFYATFMKRGVNLGPSHRGIETIKLGENCALARIALLGSSVRGMDMDPGMLDSIIQCGIVLASNPEANVVPFAVKRTHVFSALADVMYALVEKTEEGLNYTVIDERGDVKVVIHGFLTREIDLNAQQDQLIYVEPNWKEISLEEASTTEERLIENIEASDQLDQDQYRTIISGQKTYDDLVVDTFNAVQRLIQNKVEQHLIEVQLPTDKPAWRGILAALKTMSLEHPKLRYQVKQGNKILQQEFTTVEMGTGSNYVWPDNKTILITGGAGGLGRVFAQDIVNTSRGNTLILTGRSELTVAQALTLTQMEQAGNRIIYHVCDVTQKSDIERLVAQYSNINGIIHGSGVTRDNFIGKKTSNEIVQVLAPKVIGLDNLDECTANQPVDYFIVLSSIAGALGNAGQLDYAAANAYMDAYIGDRAQKVSNGQRFGKSISINWPLWDSAGMQMDEATKQNLLQVFKIKPLPVDQGLIALKKIIASDASQRVVVFGNKKSASTLFDKLKETKKEPIKSDEKKSVTVEANKLLKEILKAVRTQTATHLKCSPNQLDDNSDWAEFGFDSILLSSFVNRINSEFDLNLMPTIFFEATSIALFGQYLVENNPEEMIKKLSLSGSGVEGSVSKPTITPVQELEQDLLKISNFAQGFRKNYKTTTHYRDKDIAIVGMSCRIAGAQTLDEFWQMLDEGRDMISEIPTARWNWRDYPGVSKWGSFVDGVDEFDSLFFGISPAEAMYMAPEQRLMMQYVWECLENAGYGGDDIKGNNTGLFVGCGPTGYSFFLNKLPIEAYSATGFVPSVGPNRISYLMDWHGPSNPIETACSSALVAVHRAVEAIRAGHCEQAIAGGVNLLLAPDGYISFSKSGMLCEDGKCKTFSSDANGYVRGEGIGMLMLKPLKKALADGNQIYALVKGTAENHGGRTNSLTAPNPKSQAAVIKKAIKDAELDFSRVGYIECHGTGTSLGDPVEIKGLKTVATELLEKGEFTHRCKLGSIKSNIGHLEYAAGAVGLIKVILQMKHKKIAQSLHCNTLNPYIDLSNTPYEVAQQASDWFVEPGMTRVAGVSSFGFGGVNAHIVLEEFIDTRISNREEESGDAEIVPQILVLSAKNEDSLIDYVAQFPKYLKTVDNNYKTLQRIAYTLQAGRSEMRERLVFVANSIDEWVEQLEDYLRNKGKIVGANVFRGTVKNNAGSIMELSDTQAGRDYLNQLISAKEAEKIAELWSKGTKIEWKLLHS